MRGGIKLSLDELDRCLSLYAQVERRERNMLNALSVLARRNKEGAIVEDIINELLKDKETPS